MGFAGSRYFYPKIPQNSGLSFWCRGNPHKIWARTYLLHNCFCTTLFGPRGSIMQETFVKCGCAIMVIVATLT